jgi:hypothetical protein
MPWDATKLIERSQLEAFAHNLSPGLNRLVSHRSKRTGIGESPQQINLPLSNFIVFPVLTR